ncbi:hypothetical protein DVH24_003804 [Malus domestica]|uniref:Uncharacterized protein n=1 Tax=Malus domestica TaxID=3750 RepID=A0A498KCE9_MALDO|nr:hypothetical protein DVH24_003804 [Malus domestica]
MVPKLPLTIRLRGNPVPVEDGLLSKDHAFQIKLEYIPFNLHEWEVTSNTDVAFSYSKVYLRVSCHKELGHDINANLLSSSDPYHLGLCFPISTFMKGILLCYDIAICNFLLCLQASYLFRVAKSMSRLGDIHSGLPLPRQGLISAVYCNWKWLFSTERFNHYGKDIDTFHYSRFSIKEPEWVNAHNAHRITRSFKSIMTLSPI